MNLIYFKQLTERLLNIFHRFNYLNLLLCKFPVLNLFGRKSRENIIRNYIKNYCLIKIRFNIYKSNFYTL